MRLIDSNVLVYAHDLASPKRPAARQLLADALTGRTDACIAPQNLCELYAIITNPRRVQNPLAPADALRLIGLYWRSARLKKILPTPDVVTRFLELVQAVPVRAVDTFDAFLAATALANGVSEVYTENTADLARFGLITLNPFAP